jgi:iron complex outermembrane receptor protein
MMLQAQEKKDSIKQKEIEQVVLIGYGAKKKSDLTGSITSLQPKILIRSNYKCN